MVKDIFTVIKNDHDKAKDIMADIMVTNDIEERLDLLDELKQEILLHAKTEEATFYRRMKQEDKEMREEMDHAKKEHETVEKFFREIGRLDPELGEWFVKFGQIRQALEHHMMEEEEEIFPEARKMLDRQEALQLGQDMMDAKMERKSAA